MNEVINIDKLGEWLKAHPEIESITVDNPYHEKYNNRRGEVIVVYQSVSDLLNDDTCQSKP